MRTIVLVHGAWHGAWCWAKQQAELGRRGLTSLAVDLPGHGASTLPLGDLYGDAEHTAAVLARVPGEVVLVGHSYGGAVITEAAALASNVAHLVYLTAFCLDEGSTVMDGARSSPTRADLGAAQRIGDDGMATLDLALAVAPLYGDCDPAEVSAALPRLCPQPLATFTQPIRTASWKTIPSTYVACTDDRAITIELQRLMAARCGTTVELPASHSPFLSMPGAVADVLEPLARAVAS